MIIVIVIANQTHIDRVAKGAARVAGRPRRVARDEPARGLRHGQGLRQPKNIENKINNNDIDNIILMKTR